MEDVNEIISKLQENDEIEITVSVYGQNIKLRGIVVTCNKNNITIMQNGSNSQTIPMEQISDISIIESSGKISKSQKQYVGYIEISKKYNVYRFKVNNFDYIDIDNFYINFFYFCAELLTKINYPHSEFMSGYNAVEGGLCISAQIAINPYLDTAINIQTKKEVRKLIKDSNLTSSEKRIYYKLLRSYIVIEELLTLNNTDLSRLKLEIENIRTSKESSNESDEILEQRYNSLLDYYRCILPLIEFYKNKNIVKILQNSKKESELYSQFLFRPVV